MDRIANPHSEDLREHYQLLENQVFRKTYVAVKKEIDEWLRSQSLFKSMKKPVATTTNQAMSVSDAANNTHSLQQRVMDSEENEFITQLQRSNQSNL